MEEREVEEEDEKEKEREGRRSTEKGDAGKKCKEIDHKSASDENEVGRKGKRKAAKRARRPQSKTDLGKICEVALSLPDHGNRIGLALAPRQKDHKERKR